MQILRESEVEQVRSKIPGILGRGRRGGDVDIGEVWSTSFEEVEGGGEEIFRGGDGEGGEIHGELFKNWV
jgi:hypothetical protein